MTPGRLIAAAGEQTLTSWKWNAWIYCETIDILVNQMYVYIYIYIYIYMYIYIYIYITSCRVYKRQSCRWFECLNALLTYIYIVYCRPGVFDVITVTSQESSLFQIKFCCVFRIQSFWLPFCLGLSILKKFFNLAYDLWCNGWQLFFRQWLVASPNVRLFSKGAKSDPVQMLYSPQKVIAPDDNDDPSKLYFNTLCTDLCEEKGICIRILNHIALKRLGCINYIKSCFTIPCMPKS